MNTDNPHTAAAEVLRQLTSCRCEPAWTDRRLHAPTCLLEYREYVDEALAAAESRGEARGRQWAIDTLRDEARLDPFVTDYRAKERRRGQWPVPSRLLLADYLEGLAADDTAKGHPIMARFDQCTVTCTTDCGHCKGDPVGALRAAVEVHTEELKEAYAALDREHRIEQQHLARALAAERERDAMRPVVEAAIAWKAAWDHDGGGTGEYPDVHGPEADLNDAIDAYTEGTKP